MNTACKAQKVVVLGATGLIGNELTRQLLENDQISQVLVIGRRVPSFENHKLDKVQMDLERIDEHGELFEGASAVFCCLGTTMRQAKSREAFKRVDFDYPLLTAKTALTRGVEHFLVISAQGASTKSPFFYSRVKGELEEVLKQIPFKRLTIARPGLLLGRKIGERPMEDMAGWLMRGLTPLWRGPLQKYAAIEAMQVARAMIASFFNSSQNTRGLELIEFNQQS